MTIKKLNEIFNYYNIPETATLTSDSGWECDATEMNGVYYNKKLNTIVFTQTEEYSDYNELKDWKNISKIKGD